MSWGTKRHGNTVKQTCVPDASVVSNNCPFFNPLSVISHYKGISVTHLNVRSLTKHIDEIRAILSLNNIHILSFNETRLSADVANSEIALPGYTLVRRDRNRDGGGVLLAVSNDLDFSEVSDNNFTNIEAVSVKVLLGSKQIIFSTIYRPPSADNSYFNKLLECMERLVSSAFDVVFLGDFNLNTLQNGPDLTKVSNICDLLNLNQLVDKPTRVTPTSSTFIDLIFLNILDHHIITDVVPLTISDHYLVYTVLNFQTKCNPDKTVLTRSFTSFNKSNFIKDLSRSVILKNILNISDIHEAWNTFFEEFNYICNLHAPLLEHRIKVRGNPTPWMSKEIMTLIHKRDKLHKRAVMTKDLNDFELYKQARNEIRKQKSYSFHQKSMAIKVIARECGSH